MDDESTLIRAAQAGDRQAFERLLEARYDSIYRFALKWCGDVSDAEDVAQLACIKLAKGLTQFDHRAQFSTWLYRLVINCAQDWQRQQQRHHHADEGAHVNEASQADRSEILIYLAQVLAWIAHLGAEFKETVVLVFGEGLSHGEAADVLQVKESTVSWRIHKVRKALIEFEQPGAGGKT